MTPPRRTLIQASSKTCETPSPSSSCNDMTPYDEKLIYHWLLCTINFLSYGVKSLHELKGNGVSHVFELAWISVRRVGLPIKKIMWDNFSVACSLYDKKIVACWAVIENGSCAAPYMHYTYTVGVFKKIESGRFHFQHCASVFLHFKNVLKKLYLGFSKISMLSNFFKEQDWKYAKTDTVYIQLRLTAVHWSRSR